jgi:hypothetical protein
VRWTCQGSSSACAEIVATIPLPAQVEILRILTIRDDADRAREVGEVYRSGILTTAEDPTLRAGLVGLLRESERP